MSIITLFVLFVALVIATYWLWYQAQETRSIKLQSPQPDAYGRYFADGGLLYSENTAYRLLKEYGMKRRTPAEYRRAFKWMVATLETEGSQATGAIISWEYLDIVGIIYADCPGLSMYGWPMLHRNIAERAAIMGKQGGFR